jgi:hypothetical protein
MPPPGLAGCLLAAACGCSASRTMRPTAAGMPSIPLWGRGEAGGAANAASRGAARGRGASRCRMRRRAPFPLMSPPQKAASRASRCSDQREGRMPDLRFVVFAVRRKPRTTSWSRAAPAEGHCVTGYRMCKRARSHVGRCSCQRRGSVVASMENKPSRPRIGMGLGNSRGAVSSHAQVSRGTGHRAFVRSAWRAERQSCNLTAPRTAPRMRNSGGKSALARSAAMDAESGFRAA